MNFFKRPPRKAEKVVVLISLTSILFLAKERNITGILQRQAINVDNLHILSRRQDKKNEESYGDFPPMKTDMFDDGNSARFLRRAERIIPIEDRKDDSEIRYAAFGSSCTLGTGLENREEEAYVWKLSNLDQERGKVFSARASKPGYPAKCLASMMGDEQYDVIILEYYMFGQEGLIPLAKRIRERYPDAIIVFIRLWGPDRILRKDSHINLPSWARDKGFDSSFIHDKAFHDVYLNEGGNNWFFWSGNKNQKEIQEEAVTAVGGYLISMPWNEKPDGPGGWLDIGDNMLANNSFCPSAQGHEDITNKVKEIVDRVGVPKNPRMNPFSVVDQCYNWLQTGEIKEGMSFGPNGSMEKMFNTLKYAVEYDFDKDHEGNWFDVENQSNQEMELQIGFMATGPPPSKYPKVVATFDGVDILLNPVADSSYGENTVHVDLQQKIGMLKPNAKERIHFRALEKTEWPFRLVEVMITPTQN